MTGYFTPPVHAWRRKLSDPDPDPSVHGFSRPAFMDALSLLPLAYRMGQYISHERKNHRDPIFDFSGITLEPPRPGPYGGVPCGGLGAGAIMRGYRGDFRRWSLWPGKYVHRNVISDQFSLRIKRLDTNRVYATVLSVVKPNQDTDTHCCPRFWNWSMDPDCATYFAVYPRAWTVYEDPLPGVRVVIRQVSPFLPHDYSDTSLPVCLFHVEVVNTGTAPIEASVMFTFQNGDGGEGDAVGDFIHSPYVINPDPRSADPIYGILMSHHRYWNNGASVDQGSFAIAAQTSGIVSCCKMFVSEKPKRTIIEKRSTNAPSNGVDSGKDSSSNPNVLSFFFSGVKTLIDQNMFGSESDVYTGNEDADILWKSFRDTGHAPTLFSGGAEEMLDHTSVEDEDEDPTSPSSPSIEGYKVATALCVSLGILRPGTGSSTVFSLAWDHPVARFGSMTEPTSSVPRYYTRFFGTSGLQAFHIAAYGLLQQDSWEEKIVRWQDKLLQDIESSSSSTAIPDYYKYHLFNELYYLVDGGSIWSNSSNGQTNPIDEVFKSFIQSWTYDEKSAITATTDTATSAQPNIQMYDIYRREASLTDISSDIIYGRKSVSKVSSEDSNDLHFRFGNEVDEGVEFPASDERIVLALQSISMSLLTCLGIYMSQHNQVINYSNGHQDQVGQFLYFEGHEYLMYNTYDVHFYSSFALLQLFPQIELSIQRDFAAAVLYDDPTERTMIGEGHKAPRKVKSVVPHDLGTPSGNPWKETNAYNFQDVSNWKDLGSKFILQIFRDYKYIANKLPMTQIHDGTDPILKEKFMKNGLANDDPDSTAFDDDGEQPHSNDENIAETIRTSALDFLKDMYPICEMIMNYSMKFDINHDGMIENSGFPDQTYDIWVAKDVHAYCGGLWVAACIAMSEITDIIANYNRYLIVGDNYDYYHILASKASYVYITKLWNGRYFNYDSSTSEHHDSIMADMLAGQWYAHACGLASLVVSSDMAYSCLETIYENNVIKFGQGKLLGAVNGMRPSNNLKTKPTETSVGAHETSGIWNYFSLPTAETEKAKPANDVDTSCIQSKEVWTGTTYALAALMLHEANYLEKEYQKQISYHISDAKKQDEMKIKIDRLRVMAYSTARGIHDGGWQEFGYWFATPEAWEYNGNYRSLGYMRPLAIWAMQLANEIGDKKDKEYNHHL